MINAFVKVQSLKLSQPEIVANSIDYLEVRVIFQTGEWTGLSRFMHFKKKGTATVFDVLLVGCMVPKESHLNLDAGEWEVYLHGNSTDGVTRITTDVQTLTVKPTGFTCTPLPEMPLSAAEQIAAQAQRAEDTAKEALNEASKTGPFAQSAKEAAAAAAQSARASDASARASGSAASAASGSAASAEDFAKKAEQSAANNGYVGFEVDGSGNLIFTKTTNVTFGDFRMEEGDLILYG